MKRIAQFLRWLADHSIARRLADWIDPPKVDINGNRLPATEAGGGPGEEGK
jgi:hypothetical protein